MKIVKCYHEEYNSINKTIIIYSFILRGKILVKLFGMKEEKKKKKQKCY
jgi:hypothetical protein